VNTRTVTTELTGAPGAAPSRRAQPMLEGRNADSARRRQRVLVTLDRRTTEGVEISVSAIARAAGVDRSFLYRHRDLLEKIHALAAEPPATSERASPAVTRTSLQADLRAAHERATRLHSRVQHLEHRLSEALGERAWRETGLDAPADVDALHQQINRLEQQVIDLGLQLAERDAARAAARATNREFMARINASHPTR
jgi:chromosome segregation ATPase